MILFELFFWHFLGDILSDLLKKQKQKIMTKHPLLYSLSPFALFFVLVFISACGPPACDITMPAGMALSNTNDAKIAMDGYDVTAFFFGKNPVKGDSQFQSNYQGITYYFANAGGKQIFDANPEKYLPQFGGFCAVAASFGKVEEAQIDLFDVYEGKLYFAKNAKAQKMWNEDKKGVRDRANNQWPCLVTDAGRKI